MLILVLFGAGCAQDYGIFKRQSESEANVTKQKLIENWSDYTIWLIYRTNFQPPRLVVVIFDARDDNMNLLVGGNLSKVKVENEEMWMAVVRENTTSDGENNLLWGGLEQYSSTGVQEIWGPDEQLYGYVVFQESAIVLDRVEMVDGNTLRLSGHTQYAVGGR
jgi:hypothetical protein